MFVSFESFEMAVVREGCMSCVSREDEAEIYLLGESRGFGARFEDGQLSS